jgi:hypothetical protein
MHIAIAVVVSLAIGFGLGRIKDRAKLAAVRTILATLENKASSEVKSILAAVRAKL